jgi:pyridoxal phosphate enzyme (YggS family)
MDILKNLNNILIEIKNISNKKNVNLIAISKTFNLDYIRPIIDSGHIHFGENRVNEALLKWSNEKKINSNIKIHLVGKLQSNKIKDALQIFSYIHSLDTEKLALLLDKEEKKNNIKVKYFIQVNFGNEVQKSGVSLEKLTEFISFCRINTSLDIVGLMCIPPLNENASECFKVLKNLAVENSFSELSMGMSGDYLSAVQNGSTFVRIGSAIFGDRTN